MRAVLAFDDIDFKRHSGIISEFRKLYIKTGLFSKEMSEYIEGAFEIRTEADYDDFYLVDINSVNNQIDDARSLLKRLRHI